MIKLLHVYKSYFPEIGGLQNSIRHLVQSLKGEKINSSVYCASNENRILFDNDGNKVYKNKTLFTISSTEFLSPIALFKFRAIVKDYDVVIFHHPWPFGDLLSLMMPRKKTRVLVYHSDIVKQRFLLFFYKPFFIYSLKKTNQIIATSPDYLLSSKILSDRRFVKKVKVIPLCIDSKILFDVREEYTLQDISTKEPYALFVGFPRYYKSLDVLIRAASYMSQKIIVVGTTKLEMQNFYPEIVEIPENIIFINYVNDYEKLSLIRNSGVCVLPSSIRTEAFGMFLLEASVMSKPMVTSKIHTGTSYVNINLQTGIEVVPNSAKDLAKAISRILENEDLAAKYGKAARLRFESLFDSKVVGAKYSKLIKNLINNHNH